MDKLCSEDKTSINKHLTKSLEKLKKITKQNLIRKFESLSESRNPPLLESVTSSTTNNSKDTLPRVTILSSIPNLPKGTEDLLDLGPKFVPSKTVNNQTELDVNVQLAKLAYRLRWKEIFEEQSTNETDSLTAGNATVETIEEKIYHCPFEKFCTAPDTKFYHLETSLQHLKHEVRKVINKHKSRPVQPNLSQCQRETLSELITLKKAKKVRISISDKGGEFVLMSSTMDNKLMKKHLSNDVLYRPCKDLTQKSENEINEVWEYVGKKNHLNERSIQRLKTTHSQCPIIYLLTKTHKLPDNIPSSNVVLDDIKVRPIISGCGGPAEKVSWLIQVICNPLLQFVKAHLRNTEQLLRNLHSMQHGELKNKFLFSLDVVSLYPSVNTDAAIDTLRLYLEREKNNIHLSQFSVADIILLTKTIFQHNCFSWRRNFYQQLRGLAMGNRLAPILAILYMDRIENQAIYSDLSLSISIYYRYIDDCITPASNYEEAVFIQNKLNSQDPAIRFEIELPDDNGFLPFLNTKIKVNESGIVETGWYTKPANKGLMLNEKSHHPEHMKQASISNTINTYTTICSTDALLKEAEQTFKRRAIRNGYDSGYVDRVKQRKKTTQKPKESLPTLTIPYVSSAFTNDIKRAVKRSNLKVRILQRPQSCLKNLLVESRPYDKSCKDASKCPICHNSSASMPCTQKDVVYLMTCDLCGRGYVGETSRPLVVLYKEHYRSAANPTAPSYKNMAFSRHYSECHPAQEPKLTVKILKKTSGSLDRKITEGLFIQKLKPELNNKYEQLSVANFLV